MAKRRKAGSEPDDLSKQTTVDRKRHEANCTICAHPDRKDIDRDFVEWQSPIRIAADYGLSSRIVVYRHARATGLFAKRERNIRAALAKLIERVGEVIPSAQAVVAAVQAYAKINAAGQWIDRSEVLNLNELFGRMTREELETPAMASCPSGSQPHARYT